MIEGKIYSLRSYQTENIYIGSTTQKLCKRLQNHKNDYKIYLLDKKPYISSFEIVKYDDAYIELIENVICNDKNELRKKEGEYIRKIDCVNKVIAGRTKNEYYEEHKEELIQKQKIYDGKNKEERKEKSKKFYDKNKDEIKNKLKDYYDKNKDEVIQKKKDYYEQNKEKIKEKIKDYYEKNKDEINKKHRDYYEQNKDKINENRKIKRDKLKNKLVEV